MKALIPRRYESHSGPPGPAELLERAIRMGSADGTVLVLATVGQVQRWDQQSPGVLRLPSGRLVRGRGLKQGAGEGAPPEFGLYLQSKPPPPVDWSSRWLRWPDWWVPVNRDDARDALLELWRRAEDGRVEVACTGGRGRTGTALACLAVLDGVSAGDAVNYVRRHYHPKAVETPWQQRYVRRFQA